MNKQWNDFIDNMVFSFSNVNSFETCPYCWFKNYAMGERTGESNAFAEYGTMMHEIFELIDKKLIDESKAIDMMENRMTDIDLPMAFGHDLNKSYKEQAVTAINNHYTPLKILGLEEKVQFKVGDYSFVGYIDQVLEDSDGEIILLDHKSKASFKSKKEQAEYARQLYLYSVAIKNFYGKYPKELRFNMFRKQNLIKIEFKEKDLEESKDWVINTIDKIKKTTLFSPTDNEFLCNNLCDHRNDFEHQEGIAFNLEEFYPKTVWKRGGIKIELDTND